MADLGDLMGSLMSGLIRARRVADEQTAALAEYYKDNPLLEGLSVPRIRISELTIDMPMLIENHVEGEAGDIGDPKKIAAVAESHLKSSLAEKKVSLDSAFHKTFAREVESRLKLVKESGAPIMKESIARSVDNALTGALAKSKTTLSASEKQALAGDLRARISEMNMAKEAVTPSIVANIKTSDVKEQSSAANVVRLKFTLKEEGLEWAVKASESGGVTRSLQPE